MASEGKKTPEDKIRDKFSDNINKIDANKDQTFTDEEIKDFLENDKNSKKVSQLGELMKEHFETESEVLEQFKEVIGRICERILSGAKPGETIDLDRGRIFYFYLKHFHKEDTGVGRDIIRTIIDGSKGNRYDNVVTDIQNNDEEWFDNLPGVREIKAEFKGEQDLKKCNELLESTNRLGSEDIQWLNEYKGNGNLDSELLNKLNERLDLEKCYQLLESTDLTQEDIQWLIIQNNNGRFDSELLNKINEKINAENLKKCNELLESAYTLLQEDIQWLKEYRDNGAGNSGQELIRRIDERLQLEEANEDVARSVDNEMSRDPLSNLEVISPGFGNIKPNWNLIVQKITPKDVKKIETESDVNSLVEKIKATITEENISQYLSLPNGVTEEGKHYITYNFQNILIRHLCLHPGYKILWGKDPDTYATGMNINNIVYENNLLEIAFKRLEGLKNKTKSFDKLSNKEKDERIKEVFKENNHILFDFWLKNELNSCEEGMIGEVIAYIINYSNQNQGQRLKEYANDNTFIKSVVEEYNTAKHKAEEEKRIVEEVKGYIDKVGTVTVPENINNLFNGQSSLKILSRYQINTFKTYYDKIKGERGNHEAYNDFCNVYEGSKNFYESQQIKNLVLPNCLEAQDYVDYLSSFFAMQKDIEQINKAYNKEVSEAMDYAAANPKDDAAFLGRYLGANIKKSHSTSTIMVKTGKQFVRLWQKSGGDYRPKSFYGIPLNWKKGPNPDDIIREGFFEKIEDKWDSFVANVKGLCLQQAFGDIVGLGTGIVLSSVTLVYTGNPSLAGAAYYLGEKLGNGVAQVTWDLTVDYLGGKVLGWVGESGANRFDGIDASAGLGIGLYKRDENGNVIQAKSTGEWVIDTTFGTIATAATFQFAANLGITVTENPFKYASIDEFINKPLSNMSAAATKALIGTSSYEGVSVGDAILNQAEEEYGVQGMTKKCINVFLVTAMVKGYKATYNWSKNYSDIIGRIDQKLDEVSSFLKSKGTSIEKLSNIPGSEMKKLMKEGLSDLVDDLSVESQKGWNLIIVPMVPLAVSGLISPMLSPTGILTRRRNRVMEKIRAAKTQKEKEKYEKLLSIYENIENYIRTNILATTIDNGNLSGDAGAGNDSSQSQTQIDQQIENDFKIWDDGIIDIGPSDPAIDRPETYPG